MQDTLISGLENFNYTTKYKKSQRYISTWIILVSNTSSNQAYCK